MCTHSGVTHIQVHQDIHGQRRVEKGNRQDLQATRRPRACALQRYIGQWLIARSPLQYAENQASLAPVAIAYTHTLYVYVCMYVCVSMCVCV